MSDDVSAGLQARANLLTALLSQSMAEVQRGQGDQAVLRRQAAELVQHRDSLQAALDLAKAELDAARRSADDLAATLQAVRQRHEAMVASFSWRVTKPLRWLRLLTTRA